jgi:fructose-1,6-bisphosphatase/inositol monophosphatase family enzyme
MVQRWYKLYAYLLVCGRYLRDSLLSLDQRLKKWERRKREILLLKYSRPVRNWFYLTFRVSSKRYPSRLQLFNLALKSGAIIRKEFGKEGKASWKEDQTPVTTVDEGVSRLYSDEMSRKFKHVSVIAEEDWPRMGESTTILVLDERDGTIPGMLGVTASTVVATVAVNGIPVSTLIHDPILRRTWFAEKGKGAYYWEGGWWQWFRMWLADRGLGFLFQDRASGRRLHVSDHPLEQSINSLMWWANSVGNLDAVRPQLNSIRGAQWHNFCAVAISGGWIAEGKMVASIFGGTNPRETIAMHLLVKEAGGFATDLFGCDLVYEVSRQSGTFGQLEPINGHIICNTVENLVRILNMVAQATGVTVGGFLSSKELEDMVADIHLQ